LGGAGRRATRIARRAAADEFVGVSRREDNHGMNNLFGKLPAPGADESVDVLAASRHTRVERIVSHGHASPADGWYDQACDEFVVLLAGAAQIEYDDGSAVRLAPGDWLNIPAHRRHRVAWTDPACDSVWLAVHHGPTAGDDVA
jgi:cupin 2 domain-containing protein